METGASRWPAQRRVEYGVTDVVKRLSPLRAARYAVMPTSPGTRLTYVSLRDQRLRVYDGIRPFTNAGPAGRVTAQAENPRPGWRERAAPAPLDGSTYAAHATNAHTPRRATARKNPTIALPCLRPIPSPHHPSWDWPTQARPHSPSLSGREHVHTAHTQLIHGLPPPTHQFILTQRRHRSRFAVTWRATLATAATRVNTAAWMDAVVAKWLKSAGHNAVAKRRDDRRDVAEKAGQSRMRPASVAPAKRASGYAVDANVDCLV
uniref:Uncharacterized protein n=1 Tax=Mycena chlorophos TaxID=658473 RepID=A0ABQ0LNK6_MYCCL|nr:predicted protein [Mycena chlorophos]